MTKICGISRHWKLPDVTIRGLVVIVITVFIQWTDVSSEVSSRSLETNNYDILKEKCHSSYYTRPKCLNNTDGYGCKCGPGFHWNTEMCMYGSWKIFINNRKQEEDSDLSLASPIPSDGEFVVGQSPREKFLFNKRNAFVGDIAHLNIWNKILDSTLMRSIFSSCIFMYCGNAVQWADLRSGTRGPMKMRWPSTIVSVVLKEEKPCNTKQEKTLTCNKYCSDVIGAQCNMETVENIVWARTPAITNATVPCPGQEDNRERNETFDSASRTCYRTSENEGIWGKPYIDECIAEDLLDMKEQILGMFSSSAVDSEWISNFASDLLNHTFSNVYTNPIDVATVIDLLNMIVKLQAKSISVDVQTSEKGSEEFKKANVASPTQDDIQDFIKKFINIVNCLLDSKNYAGWIETKPPGVEGDNLLTVIEQFAATVADILEKQMMGGEFDNEYKQEIEIREHIEYKLQIQKRDSVREFMFPDRTDGVVFGLNGKAGEVRYFPTSGDAPGNMSASFGYIKVSGFRFRHLAKYLPNHEGKNKEDNINTAILALYIHNSEYYGLFNLTNPIRYHAAYLDTFNISNAECVKIEHPNRNSSSHGQWEWSRDCILVADTGHEGYCECYVPGVFALTTDMYNVNWDRGIKRPILMNIASYAGCALTTVMCLVSLIIHIKFRSSTTTASLHKNLAASIAIGQIVLMAGIDKYDHPMLCHIFAILLHYAFLSNFSWLMNEAFNQYIVITYAAHSHSDQLADNGSMIRYYVLGWLFPGVLVGAFVGSQGETYYAKDMCWIAWDTIWLFVAPALGLQAVSVMVMIFATKEHNENSYTNSEKTNRIILIQMRGLWIQIILVTVSWSFAFLSLRMHDAVIKYLYAMMNILQGAFVLVFFVFLHGEIHTVLKARKTKKTLIVYDRDQDQSMESLVNQEEEKEYSDTEPLNRTTENPKQVVKSKTRDPKKDMFTLAEKCEMVTSV
ncbi:adhesion G protein-coupled receptor L2-like isoform X2 [Ostrea edulis]|uniref:adhesion G protein-coupled receptor L2-like isoform X2 n=1 Tax=Ostrea edulis TaxID=37623 RepID=UPI0020947EC6|nr:adhesion G protein-coupled receptor L2-like isoform X2 [Ostrea edulis]